MIRITVKTIGGEVLMVHSEPTEESAQEWVAERVGVGLYFGPDAVAEMEQEP